MLTALHRRRKAQLHALLGIPDDIASTAIWILYRHTVL